MYLQGNLKQLSNAKHIKSIHPTVWESSLESLTVIFENVI